MSGDCWHGWGYHKNGPASPCSKCEEEENHKHRIATLTAERDALHRFAHGVMVACVEAGGASGDTTVQLANVRALVKERDALRADLRACAEALRGCDNHVAYHSSGYARTVGILCRDALARPGVQAVLAGPNTEVG